MTQLYIIRHGAYTSQDTPPYDLGLSPEGVAQAEKLRNRLAKDNLELDVLISSPWPRAQQTAEIIAPALNLPIQTDPEVEEWRNTGEGALSPGEIIARYMATPPDRRAFISPGEGLETWGQFAVRVCAALQRITEQYKENKIAIVAHGGVIEASFAYCLGYSPFNAAPFMMMLSPDNTSLTHWRRLHQVNIWRLERYNDASHLR